MARCVRLAFALMCAGTACGVAAAQVATLNVAATADNAFQMSISTDPLVQGDIFLTGNNWGATFTGTYDFAAPGLYYIHVSAQDFGDPASFIADMTVNNGSLFANGTDRLVTDQDNWVVSVTGFGVATMPPLSFGPDGVGPWGDRANIGNDALNIWHTPSADQVYFTATVRVIPAPSAAAILGVAAFAARRRRA